MSLQLFTNNAISLLQVAITSTTTEIQLQPGLGSLFPQPSTTGEFFLVTLETVDPPFTREIVKVTGRIGDTLTGCARGQEGTTPRNWDSMSTLVDHRVTAQTMRDAMIVGSGGTGNINGGSSVLINAPAMLTTQLDRVAYTHTNRSFKYLVTIVDAVNGNCQTFEMLVNIQGLVGSSNETVGYTIYGKVGYLFSGSIQTQLDTLAQELVVLWSNNESYDEQVSITRIQHVA